MASIEIISIFYFWHGPKWSIRSQSWPRNFEICSILPYFASHIEFPYLPSHIEAIKKHFPSRWFFKSRFLFNHTFCLSYYLPFYLSWLWCRHNYNKNLFFLLFRYSIVISLFYLVDIVNSYWNHLLCPCTCIRSFLRFALFWWPKTKNLDELIFS